MQNVLAWILGIVMVLGAIALVIVPQAAGINDAGDKGQIEQKKVMMMTSDNTMVTGSTVQNYHNQYSSMGDVTFTIEDTDGESMDSTDVTAGAMFKMDKSYGSNGEIDSITFTQQDLSQ